MHTKSQSFLSGAFKAFLLVTLLFLNTHVADAQSITFNSYHQEDGEVIPRLMLSSAISYIITEEGKIAFLLTDRAFVFQLTNEGLDEVAEEIRKDSEEEGNSVLVSLILSVASTGVYMLLDHGISIPYHKLSGAEYKDGRLLIYGDDGREIFKDFTVNNHLVDKSFPPREAGKFARELNDMIKKSK